MRIAVAGTGTAAGEVVVPWLRQSGHEVVDLRRPASTSPDAAALAEAVTGCEVALHLAGTPGRLARRRPWRRGGEGSEGVRLLASAAEAAGVHRLVTTSSSLLYADQGPSWITESSPVCVTSATEPTSESEHAVQRFADAPCRVGVVLRLGLVLGDSTTARWSVRAAQRRRPVGLGDPEGFMHVVHSDDVGPAVDAALEAPSGIYNVGSEPPRRRELVAALAEAAGLTGCALLGPVRGRWAGADAEPLGRSLRVSSSRFQAQTGWSPCRRSVDRSWFDPSPASRRLAVR